MNAPVRNANSIAFAWKEIAENSCAGIVGAFLPEHAPLLLRNDSTIVNGTITACLIHISFAAVPAIPHGILSPFQFHSCGIGNNVKHTNQHRAAMLFPASILIVFE